MSTSIKVGKTHRAAAIESDDPDVYGVGRDTGGFVIAVFHLADGRSVRIEMTPDVAMQFAISLDRMAKP